MTTGKIILLNGTSSAGKSTVARAVQKLMEEPYLHTGVDHYQMAFPPNLVNIDGTLDAEAVGWEVIYDAAGLQAVRIGPVGRQLIQGMYNMIAALADSGINLVVDDVIWDPWVLRTAVTTLYNYPAHFLYLDLSIEAANEREKTRGDRGPGNVNYFYPLVHELNGIYDDRIDVENNDLPACARLIKTAVETIKPTALKQLWQKQDNKSPS
jgi:chloramphenicol 3-O phosphotransferase